MTSTDLESAEEVSLMFRAFADPLRLRILHLLSGRELCVGDLVAALGVPQPTASRHLAALRRAGLVQSREEGPWRHYSLARATSRVHRRLIGCVSSCFGEVPEFRSDRGRLEQLGEAGGCC